MVVEIVKAELSCLTRVTAANNNKDVFPEYSEFNLVFLSLDAW